MSGSKSYAVCRNVCLFALWSATAFTSAFVPQNVLLARQRGHTFSRIEERLESQRVSASTSIAMADGDESESKSDPATPEEGFVLRKSRLVWLTGFEDLRVYDHGGFVEAFTRAIGNGETNELIIPVFAIDPEVHLRSQSASSLKRLHKSLTALEKEIESLSLPSLLSNLVVRMGPASTILPSLAKETNAVACHVVEDDVVNSMRTAQQSTCTALDEMGVEVHRWSNRLRPSVPWSSEEMPSFFPAYCEIADALPVVAPDNGKIIHDIRAKNAEMGGDSTLIRSEGIPSVGELLSIAESVTPSTVLEARSQKYVDTTEPFETVITEKWSTERGAKKALKEYCQTGNDEFTDKYFVASDAANKGSQSKKSLYAMSIARLLKSAPSANEALALREGPTRTFSSALNLGVVSARDVVDAARNRSPVTPPVLLWDSKIKKKNIGDNNRAGLSPSDSSLWGRSSEGSLSDVIEWREWFHLLAERSLALQEIDQPATSGGEKTGMTNENNKDKDPDPRESGTVNYWRWKGQHLVRYLTFPAGKDYDAQDEESRDPAILLVHGFAASAEQWERLVYSLRQQRIESTGGKDTTPPVYAVDLLGFGHSEKPGLSYTQYLWESQIIDFATEVMEAVPMVMVGNSIGGGLSAGAAASLGKKICRGLVLLNTAGLLLDPDTYDGYKSPVDSDTDIYIDFSSHTEAAINGNPEEVYNTVPLFGNKALDLFGSAIVGLIYPQIEERLSLIYGNRIENADPAVVYAIQQSALHPGSSNVIGSGQKLAPNRPLNEVLMGVGEEDGEKGFPTLVVVGLDDRVSSPAAAKIRAETFSRLERLNPDTVTLEKIADAGHCPHDEAPDKIANAMLKWFASSSYSGESIAETQMEKEC
ncbi:unnamed protein product [Pseudo-nitzschia multistriata]|uniref:Photolyase/cryptochrome alpha/beta domain-containing protein n=1 Tax=Pseudo-nitzschia multistriata TaxID=183589 RepID=A0A448ZHG3_9STRA|nr:unnamed protein product [Pseudo-nitzschia multistriata]